MPFLCSGPSHLDRENKEQTPRTGMCRNPKQGPEQRRGIILVSRPSPPTLGLKEHQFATSHWADTARLGNPGFPYLH